MQNVEYLKNPNQRTPCLLILDASGSMGETRISGKKPIDELYHGLKLLEENLKEDSTALSRVQLAIVSVGGPLKKASVLMDWTDCINFEAFPLRADGLTPLGEALMLGFDLIDELKSNLRKSGISYTRPWIFVMSDGEPTSPPEIWKAAVERCQLAQEQKKVEIFSIAVEGANIEQMSSISVKPVLKVGDVKFKELFVWLTASLSVASRSRPGDTLSLPSTDPWRHVGI